MDGYQLNNPGNIRSSSNQWQGLLDDGGGDFAQFDTPQNGVRAVMKDLQNQQKLHGASTIADVISRYAPPSENDTKGYIQFVADKTGLDPNQPVDLTDPEHLIPLAKAVVTREQGKNKLDDETYQAAFNDISPKDEVGQDAIAGDAPASAPAQDVLTATPTPPAPGAQTFDPNDLFHVAAAAQAPQAPASGPPAAAAGDQNDLIAADPAASKPADPGAPMSNDMMLKNIADNFWDNNKISDLPAYARHLIDSAGQGETGNYLDEGMYQVDKLINGKDVADQRYKNFNERINKNAENDPIGSGVANIGGSIMTGGLLKKGAALALSKFAPEALDAITAAIDAKPKTAATLIGGGTGTAGGAISASGASTGDDGKRGQNAITGAAFGLPLGLLGGFGGQALAKYLGIGAGEAPDALAAGADPNIPPPPPGGAGGSPVAAAAAPTSVRLADALDPQDLGKLQQGQVLPLTAGQRTQNVNIQRMEQTAREQGSPAMLNANAVQQAKALEPFQGILGDAQPFTDPDLSLATQSHAEDVANVLRDKYDALGDAVTAGYKQADQLGGMKIPVNGPQGIENDLLDRINTTLAVNRVSPDRFPALHSVVDDLQGIVNDAKGGNFTSTTLAQLEDWKKSLNSVNTNGLPISDAAARRTLGLVNKDYEGFLDNMAQKSVINGDNKAIDAFRNARGLAKQKFQFYDSDAGVQKILDDRSLSGEQLVNTVFGAGAKNVGKGQIGNRAATMLDLAGDKSPEMLASMQKGAMSKVLRSSLSGQVNPANQDINILNFGNMHKSLNNLIQNREFFGTVFNDTEQDYLKTLNSDLRSIASSQTGAINASGTGSRVADIVEKMGRVVNNPIFSHTIGVATAPVQKAFSMQAEALVRGKAEKGLGEFIANQLNGLDAAPAYYGGMAGGYAAGAESPENEQTEQPDNEENEPQ